MQIVPLSPLPSQEFNIVLNGQPCLIKLAQKSTGMFITLYLNDVLIIGGVICENANVIVRDAYLGFIGDFAFLDIAGNSDPYYLGLNSRYFLAYLLPTELPTGLA